MSDTTVVIGVDNEHVLELEIAYRSWVANRPQMLNEHFMFVCDGNGGDLVGWTKRLEFCRQPKSKVVLFDGNALRRAGANQREVMLTGLVWGSAKVQTKWYVKIDTDTVADQAGEWIRDEWRDEMFAFHSHKWGFTRPALFISQLDEWAESVPDLACCDKPLQSLPSDLSQRVSHPRIQSWWLLGSSEFARLVWKLVGEGEKRMPCPSQDTLLWYVAHRLGMPYKRMNMKKYGWSHGRGAIRKYENSE